MRLPHPASAPGLTKPQFPSELPITAHIDDIIDLLRRHRVLIVAGETGSGKTTQLPKACLAAGLGRRRAIAHTQPRRLAARTVSARIAEELGVELGREVGYAVRFGDRTSPDTVVKVLTDGLLLQEIRLDRHLRRYDCVIVDEAHERSLNIDFILGCLKNLLRSRQDLKVVVTSATIDVEALSRFFDNAPVVEVGGRGYPVQIVHRPPADGTESALVECVDAIVRESPVGRRDILVFQSGEREIFESAQVLKQAFAERLDVLPLYARLPNAEQQRVFAAGARQRVVLATNVAETSITVPNIGYVVDPGLARISRYSYRAKLQQLPIEPISQASAAQRAGRCGRIAPGVCYRLYGADDLASRAAYTDPEIQRTNLAAVVLTMRAFRLGDIERFPFIDPPTPRAIRDAVTLLRELQAVERDALTEIGRAMARLPVDPRLARMLVEAARTGALAEVLVVVSALAAQDPRLRPLDRRAAADQAHAEFDNDGFARAEALADATESGKRGERSDFVAILNLWHWLQNARAENTRSGFRRLLEKHFLSPSRVREWHALHRQLLLACRHLDMRLNAEPANYASLHRALLAGSLGFIGQRRDPDATGGEGGTGRSNGRPRRRLAEYDGARGLRFGTFPGSVLGRRSPRWVVAAEIAMTGQIWARTVAAIEPEWIEAAARHVAKPTFSAPRWDEKRGEAVVDERVLVYGLVVVAARKRRAAGVDRQAAREIFVLEALVRRAQRSAAQRLDEPFLRHNESLQRCLEERQGKSRRADLLVGEQQRAEFYLARLPGEVCGVASWRQFARRASEAQLAQFEMTETDLLVDSTLRLADDDYPGHLPIGEGIVPLAYKFAPGEADDGVTARVDLGTLALLDADALDWLVPGFFEQKCLALVRSLPKAQRRKLVPVPERVCGILPRLQAEDVYRQGKLTTALSAAIRSSLGIDIPVAAWRPEEVPPYLRMNVQVRGGKRRVLDQDRDLEALRSRLSAQVEHRLAEDWRAKLECHAMRRFPQQGVPESLRVRGSGGGIVVYPLLADRGGSVDLLVQADAQGRALANRRGYARLALLADANTVGRLRREVESDAVLGVDFAPLGGLSELADSLLLAAAWFCYFENRDLPTTRSAFDDRLAAFKLVPVFAETLAQTRRVLASRSQVSQAIDDLRSPAFGRSRADLEQQLESLVGAAFLDAACSGWLGQLPRYLAGMAYRIEHLPGRVKRDQARIAEVEPWERRLEALSAAGETRVAADLRMLLQEFRIASFSQIVGTRGKVSADRVRRRFEAAEIAAGID